MLRRAGTSAEGPDGRTDAELVEAARAGDRAAFAELVARHQSDVHALAYAVTGDFVQSEEVAQETFLTAWRRLSEMQRPDRFRGWVCGIARNFSRKALDEQRRAGARHSSESAGTRETDAASGEISPLDRLIHREQEGALWKALNRIPLDYRMPLVLFYGEQQSVRRLAEALELDESTVKLRLFRGRKMLRDELAASLQAAFTRRRPGKTFTAALMARLESPAREADPPRAGNRAAPGIAAVVLPALMAVGWLVTNRARSNATDDRPRVESAATPRPTVPSFFATSAGYETRAPSLLPRSTQPKAPPALLSLDFEDGAQSDLYERGIVTSCPFRPANTYCLLGELLTNAEKTLAVIGLVKRKNASIFHYSSDLILGFDYWIDFGGGYIQIRFSDSAWRNGPVINLRNVVEGTWAHTEIPLSDFTVPKGEAIEEGNPIAWLSIDGQLPRGKPFYGNAPFYVDNLKVWKGPARSIR